MTMNQSNVSELLAPVTGGKAACNQILQFDLQEELRGGGGEGGGAEKEEENGKKVSK